MILVVIAILFMIRHYNYVLLIRMHDIGALVWQENLFSQFSLESKFVCQLRETMILVTIFILVVIEYYNLILLIEIHDIDDLVS